MKRKTTIQIYTEDRDWWKNCCRLKKLSSKDLFNQFKNIVKQRLQQQFYISLQMPSDYHKSLENKKIIKNYK